jgi:hypothetical protein
MSARPRLSADRRADLAQAAVHQQGTREEWLEAALPMLRDIFSEAGAQLPPVRVSCSFPGGGSPKKRIGECWPRSRSVGEINEIFISPVLSDSAVVLGVLVHELVHAVDDCVSKHGKAFKALASAVGLEGRATSCSPGARLTAELAIVASLLGPYPHAALVLGGKAPKKPGKDVKFECAKCDFVFKVSPVMAENNQVLCCPACEFRF